MFFPGGYLLTVEQVVVVAVVDAVVVVAVVAAVVVVAVVAVVAAVVHVASSAVKLETCKLKICSQTTIAYCNCSNPSWFDQHFQHIGCQL